MPFELVKKLSDFGEKSLMGLRAKLRVWGLRATRNPRKCPKMSKHAGAVGASQATGVVRVLGVEPERLESLPRRGV